MKYLKVIMLGAFLLTTPFVITACEQESAVEEAVEEVGDTAEDIGDEIED